MDTWRLILHPCPAHGSWNMAVDEAILEASSHGDTPPTLRLYSWAPPCLSLGYAQSLADVDLPNLHSRGWDLVRRQTGGRAVLHTDELTYSVAGPATEPRLAGGVLESYQRVARVLVDSLIALGVPAKIEGEVLSSVRDKLNPVCFEIPSTYEITVGGKKLLGSAQARRKGGVLQHGSLPLMGDLTRIMQVLSYPDEGSRSDAAMHLLSRAATLESILGHPTTWDEAAQAIIKSFREVFKLNLEPGELNKSEYKHAIKLMKFKYAYPERRTISREK